MTCPPDPTPHNAPTPATPANPPAPATTAPTSDPVPFLPMHTALVLLTAVVIGLIVGGLTFIDGRSAAAAVLAGVMSAGICVPVLRTLIR